MRELLLRLAREDKGQELIEYALLAGFIVLGSVVFITAVGAEVGSLFNTVDTQLEAAGTSAAACLCRCQCWVG